MHKLRPVFQLYKELEMLLKDHRDLLHEFAGFLLPEQAVECGCYNACMEFLQARTFLRKLEVCSNTLVIFWTFFWQNWYNYLSFVQEN